MDRSNWSKFPSLNYSYMDCTYTDCFYSMTILAGNLVSNSMQDAIKLGNVRMPRSKDKEVKEEKQVQSTVNDFSFYRDIKNKKIAEDKSFSAIFCL